MKLMSDRKQSSNSSRPYRLARSTAAGIRTSLKRGLLTCGLLIGLTLMPSTMTGCRSVSRSANTASTVCTPCARQLQQIETPRLDCDTSSDGDELITGPPVTIGNYRDVAAWDLSVDQCVEMALANSKILQKLGGVVVSSPEASRTLFDQAIQETGALSVENALSAFDAELNSSFVYGRSERIFNNAFLGGGAGNLVSNTSRFQTELSKQTASGASFAVRNLTDYNRNNSPVNLFGSAYDMVNQMEFRQPLLRNRGTAVNRIAGPNATAGQYNGVLIRRIRSDISLADFQLAVRDLVRDVEQNYWELHFAYRDLDTKLAARESSRETWENRKLRFDEGLGRPDDEAQARQQYYNFDNQAKNALAGTGNGQLGVLGAERALRRLMGVTSADGRLIRPITDPVQAPIGFDWQLSQQQALQQRVELNRQKWSIRQRELELLAAKALNQWRFDFVGQYGFRGFGDNLLGSRSRPNGSAVDSLAQGNLDDWQLGVELGGPIGNRAGHLAIRNAELNLVRERAILKEQQRQILHDLNAAYTEVDRALEAMKSTFNSRVAAFDELEPKRRRVEEGQDQVFFLLDAQQRTATAESSVHRAVADYNQALLNYVYTSGAMLSRYNVRLTEGQWSQWAEDRSLVKSGYRENQPKVACLNDICPVSNGAFNQDADVMPMLLPVETVVTPQPTRRKSEEQSDEEDRDELDLENLESDDGDDGEEARASVRPERLSERLRRAGRPTGNWRAKR